MATVMASAPARVKPLNYLGVLWLIYGAACLGGTIWLAFFVNTAALMFGALLNRVAHPFSLMGMFHVFYGVVIAFGAITGIIALLAGASLMAGRASARALALIAGFLALPDLPLGVILGVYTIVMLLPGSSAAARSL